MRAKVVRGKEAENVSFVDARKKFHLLPKVVQRWDKQYEADALTQQAGRRAVSPERSACSCYKTDRDAHIKLFYAVVGRC